MLQIHCSGTPYEIGLQHGRAAREQVTRTIAFYATLFEQSAKRDWPQVQLIAAQFEPTIRKKWPAYLEEMRGLAAGAGVEALDIVAINVRTEINFGLYGDGCTALGWRTRGGGGGASFLAQNWDWQRAQQENLVLVNIDSPTHPSIKMVTEAGLIGKIGMNSAGVGVCLNAISARGMDPTRLPCHLALRMVLESGSREDAVAKLDRYGVASACHLLIADASGSVGCEYSYVDVQKVGMDAEQRVFHSNHYLLPHPGVQETVLWDDSSFRVKRIDDLCTSLGPSPSSDAVQALFVDEENYPAAICRKQEGSCNSETLFNIVMDLQKKVAKVTLGRPVAPKECYELSF